MRQLSPQEGKSASKVTNGLGASIHNQQNVNCVHPVISGRINMCDAIIISMPGVQLLTLWIASLY